MLFVQDNKFVGAKEEEVLFTGEPQFGSCNNRIEYGGKGLKGSGKGKGKSNRHCSANFEKPMVPCDSASAKGSVLSDGSVSDSASLWQSLCIHH